MKSHHLTPIPHAFRFRSGSRHSVNLGIGFTSESAGTANNYYTHLNPSPRDEIGTASLSVRMARNHIHHSTKAKSAFCYSFWAQKQAPAAEHRWAILPGFHHHHHLWSAAINKRLPQWRALHPRAHGPKVRHSPHNAVGASADGANGRHILPRHLKQVAEDVVLRVLAVVRGHSLYVPVRGPSPTCACNVHNSGTAPSLSVSLPRRLTNPFLPFHPSLQISVTKLRRDTSNTLTLFPLHDTRIPAQPPTLAQHPNTASRASDESRYVHHHHASLNAPTSPPTHLTQKRSKKTLVSSKQSETVGSWKRRPCNRDASSRTARSRIRRKRKRDAGGGDGVARARAGAGAIHADGPSSMTTSTKTTKRYWDDHWYHSRPEWAGIPGSGMEGSVRACVRPDGDGFRRRSVVQFSSPSVGDLAGDLWICPDMLSCYATLMFSSFFLYLFICFACLFFKNTHF